MTRMSLADRVWTVARPLSWMLVAVALIAPAIAMLFTSKVAWTTQDFAAAAILLIGGGLICEAFAWKVRSAPARIAFSVAVVLLVAVIWGSAIN